MSLAFSQTTIQTGKYKCKGPSCTNSSHNHKTKYYRPHKEGSNKMFQKPVKLKHLDMEKKEMNPFTVKHQNLEDKNFKLLGVKHKNFTKFSQKKYKIQHKDLNGKEPLLFKLTHSSLENKKVPKLLVNHQNLNKHKNPSQKQYNKFAQKQQQNLKKIQDACYPTFRIKRSDLSDVCMPKLRIRHNDLSKKCYSAPILKHKDLSSVCLPKYVQKHKDLNSVCLPKLHVKHQDMNSVCYKPSAKLKHMDLNRKCYPVMVLRHKDFEKITCTELIIKHKNVDDFKVYCDPNLESVTTTMERVQKDIKYFFTFKRKFCKLEARYSGVSAGCIVETSHGTAVVSDYVTEKDIIYPIKLIVLITKNSPRKKNGDPNLKKITLSREETKEIMIRELIKRQKFIWLVRMYPEERPNLESLKKLYLGQDPDEQNAPPEINIQND